MFNVLGLQLVFSNTDFTDKTKRSSTAEGKVNL